MFDLDHFTADCRAAMAEAEPRRSAPASKSFTTRRA